MIYTGEFPDRCQDPETRIHLVGIRQDIAALQVRTYLGTRIPPSYAGFPQTFSVRTAVVPDSEHVDIVNDAFAAMFNEQCVEVVGAHPNWIPISSSLPPMQERESDVFASAYRGPALAIPASYSITSLKTVQIIGMPGDWYVLDLR